MKDNSFGLHHRKLSVLSDSSQSSILSRDLIRSQAASELKPSTTKQMMSKVTLWSPVVIENNFPDIVQPTKLEYMRGDTITQHEFPPDFDNIVGGLIMRLPLTDIAAALRSMITLEEFRGDDELITSIDEIISDWRASN